jgi:hypothetical protein
VLLQDGERVRARVWGAQPVRDRLRDDREGLARLEGNVHGRRELRLGRDDEGPPGDRGGDPGYETSAAGRHDHHLHVGTVLEELEPHGALAGLDERVVEGMNESPALVGLDLLDALEGLGRVRRLEVDRGAVAAGSGDLLLTCPRPHDDEAVDPLERAAVGEGARMVPGGDRDDAAGALVRGERGELREDAADLERARLLEELALEDGRAAERLTERGRRQERRSSQPVADRRRGSDRIDRLHAHMSRYSGPEPPSPGVRRPPLAEIAPHCTQFDAVTSTETTLPAGLASPVIS